MQPLNLFLRAFFSSRLLAQCNPSQHILFIPTASFWLSHKDHDTAASYAELLTSDEFLACHIVRLQHDSKDTNSLKESKTKAKQYTTVNGRVLVIKDNTIYTNKGFKSLCQAQILKDTLYHQDTLDSSQWLIYYISRPLVGTPEPLYIIPNQVAVASGSNAATPTTSSLEDAVNGQKEIKSFQQLLEQFPIISRQMMPSVEKLFAGFATEMELVAVEQATRESLSPISSRSESISTATTAVSKSSGKTNELSRYVSHESANEEMQIRRSLETLIYATIDAFQAVDQNQLSLVGSSTNLSGPLVEKLIERYVSERFHDTVLFPRLCSMLATEDEELESAMKPMVDIDISQVGITIDDMAYRKVLTSRVLKGVEQFRKMKTASSPQDMIEILLQTQKALSTGDADTIISTTNEKSATNLFMSADTLVSLMLVVVIRAPVSNLQARLAYMRDFVFVENVDTGEIGYALSTFEAVLEYLSSNAAVLRRASRANRSLWLNARRGDLKAVRAILEPEVVQEETIDLTEEPLSMYTDEDNDTSLQNSSGHESNLDGAAIGSGLAHVFPHLHHASDQAQMSSLDHQFLKTKKRVSMAARSMSSSSARSYMSGTSTAMSIASIIIADTSPHQLARTEDALSRSVLFAAILGQQTQILQYLLSLKKFYDLRTVVESRSKDGSTLLMEAVKTENAAVIDVLMKFLENESTNRDGLLSYLNAHDDAGRTVAHYLFHSPSLISRLGAILPWQKRDKNGQTPFMSICRSYDHAGYSQMLFEALEAAIEHQSDGQVLHLDQHIDNKGNTPLHVIKDPQMMKLLLLQCDVDINAKNEKSFTSLMVASRFGRIDTIRTLFGDPRLDAFARDTRGLTAAELAKDDEIRGTIDDALLLILMHAREQQQVTSIVRSHLVEEANLRFVIKTGSPNSNSTITVTTCRRLATDVMSLYTWLAIEHPASFLPSVPFRSPFQISNKPSKAVMRDMQIRYDRSLRTMLLHPTFSMHETLWEFVLVPDIDLSMLAERTTLKASVRVDNLREDYEPLLPSQFAEVEVFVSHARDQVQSVRRGLMSTYRRLNNLRTVRADLHDAAQVQLERFTTFFGATIGKAHQSAIQLHVASLQDAEMGPSAQLSYALSGMLSSANGILTALHRPAQLMNNLQSLSNDHIKYMQNATKSHKLPSGFGLLDDFRGREQADSLNRAEKAKNEMISLGRELRYTQTTVAAELSGWQGQHPAEAKHDLRAFARRMVVQEKDRMDTLQRALRIARGGHH